LFLLNKFKDSRGQSREATHFNKETNYQEENERNANSSSEVDEESSKNLLQTIKAQNTGQNDLSKDQVSSQACSIQ
jgi:hypothetical protein